MSTTSAQNLSAIISTLSRKYKFSENEAIECLWDAELLPKKMAPKKDKPVYIWASKKAEELATTHGVTLLQEGNGSGKDGKYTIADIQKLIQSPVKEKMLVSPNALTLAKEHGIDLVGKKGSGKDGRILLKDVEKLITNDDSEHDEELNISPRALIEAQESGMSDEDLSHLHGSGKDGKILLSDVKKFVSESEKSDED